MPKISDTAYPRLKAHPSLKELERLFTPSPDEKRFAWSRTNSETNTIRLLVWLKVFQRLGYFPSTHEISIRVTEHIANSLGAMLDADSNVIEDYGGSRLERTHHELVRQYLSVTAYGADARSVAKTACLEAAKTRDDLVDIVNVAIEELIRQRFELPGCTSLLRLARSARTRINGDYHQQVFEALSDDSKNSLKQLFERTARYSKTTWDNIKREPKKPSVRLGLQTLVSFCHFVKDGPRQTGRHLLLTWFDLQSVVALSRHKEKLRSLWKHFHDYNLIGRD